MTAREIVMEERRKLVEKLIENMKKGYIFKPGWDILALRPQNPVSGAMYKGGNRLKLINAAIEKEYDDPRWLTFIQATEKGYNVKKGEKGIRCEKWIFTEKVKEKDPETGKMIVVEKELENPFPTYFTVFNAKQIENIPPLEIGINKVEKSQISEIVNDVIDASECPIKFIAQDRAYYSPLKDEIILPLREAFKSEESFLATALHEIGHSTGHESRLNRNIINVFGTKEYAKEELVAELCAVFTQANLNIKLEGEHFNNHSSYLESWIKVLENNPNELYRAASEAEKAADRIYNNYLEREKQLIKELDNELKNLDKPNSKKIPLFRGLVIDFGYSEKNLGIEEDTILRGIDAYKFLEKLNEEDKKQNLKQKYIDEEEKKGNRVPGAYYYKTKLDIQYKDYYTGKIRIDLGDLEFGGKEKVSDALEYRLKSWPYALMERKYEFARLEKMTPEEIVEEAQKIIEHIDKIMKPFRKQESLYLDSLLEQKKDNILELTKENPWAKKLDNDRNKSLTLGR